MRAPPPPEVAALARRLSQRPPRAGGRILADATAWVGLAMVGAGSGSWPVVAVAVFLIGFVVQHDLLIHGHEAVHRLVSRRAHRNELALWALHAIVFTSGTAHRAFHLDHHRWTHEARDPEGVVVERLLGGRGIAFLVLPAVAMGPVHLWPFLHRRHRRLRARVVRDLVGIAVGHGALVALLGPGAWLTWCVAPIVVGLGPAFVLRSLPEHHGRPEGDPWRSAGRVRPHRWMHLAWSGIEHHLEHHLFPKVPVRHLPELRAALEPEYRRRGLAPEGGWVATAWKMLRRPTHRVSAAAPPAGTARPP